MTTITLIDDYKIFCDYLSGLVYLLKNISSEDLYRETVSSMQLSNQLTKDVTQLTQ